MLGKDVKEQYDLFTAYLLSMWILYPGQAYSRAAGLEGGYSGPEIQSNSVKMQIKAAPRDNYPASD